MADRWDDVGVVPGLVVGPDFSADRDRVMIARTVVSVLFGSVCGSFAALVADRVPRGESIATGRSRCVHCGRVLRVRDLVPILSWLVARGRCRSCGVAIGSTCLVVEALTATMFALCAFRLDDPVELAAHWVLCTGLVSLSVIDVFTMKLPRQIIHVTAACGLPLLVAASFSIDDPTRLSSAIVGSLGALGAMMVLYVVSAGRLGDGDVRLSPLLGLYLGWKDMSAVFSGFFLAFVLGAVCGLGLVAVRCCRSLRSPSASSQALPFGPFLAVGTMAIVLFDLGVPTMH